MNKEQYKLMDSVIRYAATSGFSKNPLRFTTNIKQRYRMMQALCKETGYSLQNYFSKSDYYETKQEWYDMWLQEPDWPKPFIRYWREDYHDITHSY